MPIIGAIGAAAAGGGRYVNPKPIITYQTTGVFNITNADVTANYSANSSVTGGSLTFGSGNSTVSLSQQNTVATITNKSIKGVTTAPPTLAERKSYSYGYATYPPPFNNPWNPFISCGGTVHGNNCMAFYPSPHTYLVPAPGYTSGSGEWYKIT